MHYALLLTATCFGFASLGISTPTEYATGRSASDQLLTHGSPIGAGEILNAFKAQGHPSAVPRKSWQDDTGFTYQAAYDFDTEEWDSMHSRLLEELFGANATTELAARDAEFNPVYTACQPKKNHPRAYTYTLGALTNGVCGAFVFTGGYYGRTQVVERYKLEDAFGESMTAVFKWTWFATKFASVNSCAGELQYQINTLCDNEINGNQGKASATRGSKAEYADAANKVQLKAEVQTQKDN